jgi:dimethylamine--corrinoid protein Co-methyltransferase
MRLQQAKDYVAGKLGVTPFDLSDPAVMTDIRGELGFGRIHSYAISQPGQANMIEAKFRIAQVLGIPINCVERFKERAGLQGRRAGCKFAGLAVRSPARAGPRRTVSSPARAGSRWPALDRRKENDGR